MIDANVDRTAEALRVVGDITRFILDNKKLAQSWRSIRSELWDQFRHMPSLQQRLVESRDSQEDIGRQFKSSSHQDIKELARVNIHRAQESLRVLEESFRTAGLSLVGKFMELRYRCYDLEPQTLSELEEWSLTQKLDFGLYVVLGREFSKGRDFVEVAEKAIAGGAGAIQLREKDPDMPVQELLGWAYRLCELTRRHNVTFIINDRIDIALAVGADGVHLGQDDFPIPEARRITGPHFIIGASTHSLDEAQCAVEEGATYFNIGPIFKTSTKEGAVNPAGPELISKITSVIQHPFTVMGGIKLDNVDEVLKRGARCIAVVTAVVAADDITSAAQAFTDKIQHYKNPSG